MEKNSSDNYAPFFIILRVIHRRILWLLIFRLSKSAIIGRVDKKEVSLKVYAIDSRLLSKLIAR